jgi:hypothetical protein
LAVLLDVAQMRDVFFQIVVKTGGDCHPPPANFFKDRVVRLHRLPPTAGADAVSPVAERQSHSVVENLEVFCLIGIGNVSAIPG